MTILLEAEASGDPDLAAERQSLRLRKMHLDHFVRPRGGTASATRGWR